MMKTGLIERLEKTHNYNIRKWLEETLSRQFGMCCSLREESYLTKQEILNELCKDSASPYPDKPKFFTKEMAYQAHLDNKEYYEELLKETLDTKEKYEKDIIPALNKIKSIATKQENNLLLSVLKLAFDQIDLMRDQWSENTLQKYREQIARPFIYDEESAKRNYESNLEWYNERMQELNNKIDSKTTAADGYKEFLRQIEEVWKQL